MNRGKPFQIGPVKAAPGVRAFGCIEVAHTLSRIPITLPINIVNGKKDGPTLVVSAAIHGQELVGSMGIGRLLRELDPEQLCGQLIAIPVVNTSAFEFAQRTTPWDNKDLNRQGRGNPRGTVSEQLASTFFEQVLSRADYLVDIHSGGPDSYYYYTIYLAETSDGALDSEVVATSGEMALSFGMEHIFAKTPWRGTFKEEAMKMGIPSIAVEMGGGADFFVNGSSQLDACVRGLYNVMSYLDMVDKPIYVESSTVKLWDAHTEIVAGEESGFIERQAQWGDYLSAGDVYAHVYHPYTGEALDPILAPAAGTVLNSSTVWPAIPPRRWLAVLGDLLEVVEAPYPKTPQAERVQGRQ